MNHIIEGENGSYSQPKQKSIYKWNKCKDVEGIEKNLLKKIAEIWETNDGWMDTNLRMLTSQK